MKRVLAILLGLTLLAGCGAQAAVSPAPEGDDPAAQTQAPPSDDAAAQEDIELTLWTYPVGGWGSSSTVSSMITAFRREYPHIQISVHAVDYTNGDAEIEQAIADGTPPDLVLEGPERLVANWGARGLMADLSDLWQDETAAKIYPAVEAACRNSAGAYYIYPLCMTTHCMAINRDMFEAAGAWQYIDEATHTWTTDGFVSAVQALYDAGSREVADIYCGGQGGDQGTRALINNLYSGRFANADHTRYVFNSPENIQALELLRGMDGIRFAPDMLGADEITRFCNGELAMSFCWSVAQEVNQVISNPNLDFDIFPMAFPTNDGEVNLQGGIWGFGVFDNGDPVRAEAAKTFIRYMTEDENVYSQAVLASSYWPVREMPSIYENDDLMTEYSGFQQYMGDYYQVTLGWAQARKAWWEMLQSVGKGDDIAAAVQTFEDTANAAAAG